MVFPIMTKVLSFCLLLICVSLNASSTTRPPINPESEAEVIAMKSTHSLLSDPALVMKIMTELRLIRSKYPEVAQIYFIGRNYIGKVQINPYTQEVDEKLRSSKFAPILNAKTNGFVSFRQQFNPDVLVSELEKIGIHAEPIAIPGPYFGEIDYNVENSTYTFMKNRENYTGAGDEGTKFVFKVGNGGEVVKMD